jgi:hypothetical protein
MVSQDCFMDIRDNWIGQHKGLPVLPNGFPIGPLHLLLVAAQHREELRLEDLESALDFARAHPQYLLFHNMRATGASRPEHLHFQAVLRDESLPIETTGRRVIFHLDGATVARLEGYPVFGLAVRGKGAAEAAFVILRMLHPTPFNLVMSQGEVIVVPRTTEKPSGFTSTFGGLEMAGCIVLTEEAHYRSLEYDQVWRALAECGLAPRERGALEERVRHTLLGSREGRIPEVGEDPRPLQFVGAAPW